MNRRSKQNFHDQIYAGVKQELLVKFYKNAIANVLVQGGQSEEDANAYVEANKEAIEKRSGSFCKRKSSTSSRFFERGS